MVVLSVEIKGEGIMLQKKRMHIIFFSLLIFPLIVISRFSWAQMVGSVHVKVSQITNLVTIHLHPGINKIVKFTPDGRGAIIVRAWRENGDAHGYNLFLVMIDNAVVGVYTEKQFEDVVRDDPHTFEDVVRSVRFARGKISGVQTTFLITATRTTSFPISLATPGYVVFDFYQLVHAPQLGTTEDFFRLVSQFSSKKKYCNSDLALFKEIGLPLPATYEGLNKIDGCP